MYNYIYIIIYINFFHSPEVLPAWLNDYPVTIIQFLFFLYRNFTDFMQVFMSAEVLGALAGTLFPKPVSSSQDSSGASTPADEVIMFFVLQDVLSEKRYFQFYVYKIKYYIRVVRITDTIDIFKHLLYKLVKSESIFGYILCKIDRNILTLIN